MSGEASLRAELERLKQDGRRRPAWTFKLPTFGLWRFPGVVGCAAAYLGLMVIFAVFADVIAPYSYEEQNLLGRLQPPFDGGGLPPEHFDIHQGVINFAQGCQDGFFITVARLLGERFFDFDPALVFAEVVDGPQQAAADRPDLCAGCPVSPPQHPKPQRLYGSRRASGCRRAGQTRRTG